MSSSPGSAPTPDPRARTTEPSGGARTAIIRRRGFPVSDEVRVRPGLYAFVAVVAVVGLAALVAPPSTPPGPPPSTMSVLAGGGSGLLLRADPTEGYAPLLVGFNVTAPNGSAPAWSWSFGDGSFYNGTGPAFTHPSHAYASAGHYVARVVATYPTGSLNASVPITVLATTVFAAISAHPENGTAPLTVFFNGSATGGSGTYTSFTWAFGDGGVGSGPYLEYTYPAAGHFEVTLVVTDSLGGSARASMNLSVSAPLSTKPNSTPARSPSLADPLGWLNGVVLSATLAVGIASLLAGALWVLWARRRHDDSPSPHHRPGSNETPTQGPRFPSPFEPGGPGDGTADEGAPTAATSATAAGATAPPPARLRSAPPERSLPGRRQLTYQILEEMGRLPRLAPGELATRAWTQAGLSERLGVGQSGMSKILRRLVEAGVLSSATEHVHGSERRLRVYRLTPRGEQLARALRSDPERPAPGAP